MDENVLLAGVLVLVLAVGLIGLIPALNNTGADVYNAGEVYCSCQINVLDYSGNALSSTVQTIRAEVGITDQECNDRCQTQFSGPHQQISGKIAQ